MLCSISPTPLPPSCPGFVAPRCDAARGAGCGARARGAHALTRGRAAAPLRRRRHTAPSAAECGALAALANGTTGVGCSLAPGACPASACDLYCAFDAYATSATSTTDAAAPKAPPAAAKPPPSAAAAAAGGGSGAPADGDARAGAGRDRDRAGAENAPKRSSSGGSGSGAGGIIAGVIFGVVGVGGAGFVLHRTGHLAAARDALGAALGGLRGGGAAAEGFEMMDDLQGATIDWDTT